MGSHPGKLLDLDLDSQRLLGFNASQVWELSAEATAMSRGFLAKPLKRHYELFCVLFVLVLQ